MFADTGRVFPFSPTGSGNGVTSNSPMARCVTLTWGRTFSVGLRSQVVLLLRKLEQCLCKYSDISNSTFKLIVDTPS